MTYKLETYEHIRPLDHLVFGDAVTVRRTIYRAHGCSVAGDAAMILVDLSKSTDLTPETFFEVLDQYTRDHTGLLDPSVRDHEELHAYLDELPVEFLHDTLSEPFAVVTQLDSTSHVGTIYEECHDAAGHYGARGIFSHGMDNSWICESVYVPTLPLTHLTPPDESEEHIVFSEDLWNTSTPAIQEEELV